MSQYAEQHDVWVLTSVESRGSILAAMEARPLPNVHVIFVDAPFGRWYWTHGAPLIHLHYYCWQIAALYAGRALHRTVSFDFIHHASIAGYWMPSFLVRLPVPFVWGPVGGGERVPRPFLKTFRLRDRLFESVRSAVQALAAWDPFLRRTARDADVALVSTEETAARVRRLGAREPVIMSQVALSAEDFAVLSAVPRRTGGPFRVLTVGNLLHWKGVHLALGAFVRLRARLPESEYWIVGDGPQRQRLTRLARALGVIDAVRFLGALPRKHVLQAFGECDVLAHPSLHESGGFVCAEAMAAGRPVICLDLGGPALQVTPTTGYRIRALSPAQVVEDMAEAMYALASDSDMLNVMGAKARARVRDHFRCDGPSNAVSRVAALLSARALTPQAW